MKATLKTLTLLSFLLLTNCAPAYAAKPAKPTHKPLSAEELEAARARYCRMEQDVIILIYESSSGGVPISKMLDKVGSLVYLRPTVIAVYKAQQSGESLFKVLEDIPCSKLP